jgi:hypothetical protein
VIEEWTRLLNQTKLNQTFNLILRTSTNFQLGMKDEGDSEIQSHCSGPADTFEEEKIEEEDGEDNKDGDKDRDKDEHEFDTSLEPIKAMLLKVCLRFITLIPSWLTC